LPVLPPIPATGKRFSAAFEATVIWCGDQIAAMSLGLVGPGVLQELDVPLPG
jgi:hypothetical protein